MYILFVSVMVGAIIGYITNYLAILMLFKPKREIKFLFFKIPKGVILREKELLAKKIAKLAKDYIFTKKELRKILKSNKVQNKIEEFVEWEVRRIANMKISEIINKEEFIKTISGIIYAALEENFKMFANFMDQENIKYILSKFDFDIEIKNLVDEEEIKRIILKEVKKFLLRDFIYAFINSEIELIIKEKIESLDDNQIEEIVIELMQKHFAFIKFTGAVLGAIIGLVQYLLFLSN